MSLQIPIGSCCSRPRLNSVGGIDDIAWTLKFNDYGLVKVARKVGRTTSLALAGILAAVTVVSAYAVILLTH